MPTAKKRLPQWLPWTMVLLLLTGLALLDPRQEPAAAKAAPGDVQVD
jgi:hypothetical protein